MHQATHWHLNLSINAYAYIKHTNAENSDLHSKNKNIYILIPIEKRITYSYIDSRKEKGRATHSNTDGK